MNTSLGYAKKTLTNSNVLLSGGGDKALSDFSMSGHNHDDLYVSSLTTNGNSLRWVKNGSNNDITIPYATNADTVDGYHASDLVRFFLSPMTSGAPADSAKSWFTETMPSASGAIVYNVPGSEKTIIAGKSSGAYGHMLQLNYDDTYLRILRYHGGSWKSTDWEKISAGYADSAALDSNGRSLVTYKEYSGTFPPNDGTRQWYTILNQTQSRYSQSAILEISTRATTAIILIAFYDSNIPHVSCLNYFGQPTGAYGGFTGRIRIIVGDTDDYATIQGEFYATSNTTASRRRLGLKVYCADPSCWTLPDSIVADTATHESFLIDKTFTINGSTLTHIFTHTDDTYDIGSSALRFRNIYATTFHGELNGNASSATTAASCTGNALTATKATQDSDGNAINTTYLKLGGGNAFVSAKPSANNKYIEILTKDMGKNWEISNLVASFSTRHTGNGILCITCNGNNTYSGAFIRIRCFCGGDYNRSSFNIKAYRNDTTGKLRIFFLRTDNDSIVLNVLSKKGLMNFNTTFTEYDSIPDDAGTEVNIVVNTADTATQLETARTIWGQSFDGTANISGNMTDVGTILASGDISISNTTAVQKQFKVINSLSELWMGVNNKGEAFLWTPSNKTLILGTNNSHRINILSNGNVGIGTTSPAYKLDVNGNIKATNLLITSINGVTVGNSPQFTDTTYSAGTLALYNTGTDTENRVWSASVLKSIGNLYLPLAGGTIASSNFGVFNIQRNHTTNAAAIGFKHYSTGTTVETMGYIGMHTKDGTLRRWNAAADTEYIILDSSNSSVSKNGETLTVKINGTTQSLTNTNTTYSAGTAELLSAGTDTTDRVWKAKIIKDEMKKYVSTSGNQTLNGILTIAPSHISAYQDALILYDSGSGGNEGARIRFTSASYTTGITLGPNSDKSNLMLNDAYALIHTGNISSYFKTINGNSIIGTGNIEVGGASGDYLPLAGGTMTGAIYRKMSRDESNAEDAIVYVNTSGTPIATMEYHNTTQRLIFNAIGSSSVWSDSVGKYSFIVGNNELKYNTHNVWHAGNDGADSGLDADLLDGRHATDFAYGTNGVANSASALANKTVTASTLNGLSGSFTFEGNDLTTSGYDEVGIQIGSSVDKFQIIGKYGTLLVRQNDSGGTNTSGWGDWTLLPTKVYTNHQITAAGWYRVANLTTYGLSYIISMRENYYNSEPNPATFIINTSYTNATITQIGRAARTPVSITKLRVVKYGNGTFHVDVYANTASMNVLEVNIFNLGRENTSDGISLVGWTSASIASGETLIEETDISTGTTLTGDILLNNAQYIGWKNSSGTAQNICIGLNSSNDFLVGWKTAGSGYNTYLDGNNVSIRYGTSRSSGIYLNSSGNVGIGTTSPSYKLHVNGSISSNYVRLVDSSTNPYLQFINGSTNWYLQYYNNAMYMGTGTTNSIMINSSGNVGIGTTSPSYKLHVEGTGYYSSNLLVQSISIGNTNEINSTGSSKLWLQYRNSGALVLCHNGANCGVGADNPAYKLDVNGDVRATNFYTTSDRNKKKNISEFSEHIRKFQLKDTEKWNYGVIAQEVEEMFREGKDGNMTVNYDSVLSYYIGLLENKVKALEEKIRMLETKQNKDV